MRKKILTPILTVSIFALSFLYNNCSSRLESVTAPEQFTGRVGIFSDVESSQSPNHYMIVDASGKAFELSGNVEQLSELRDGDQIQIDGAKSNNLFILQGKAKVLKSQTLTKKQNAVASSVSTNVVKKILIISASYSDAAGADPASVAYYVMSDDTGSANRMYKELSNGRFSFVADSAPAVQIATSQSVGCSNVYGIMAQADAAVVAAGQSITGYDLKVYAFPGGCGNRGLSAPGFATNYFWYDALTWAHEIGHGLGMQHASTPGVEYGDHSDFMGYGGGTITMAAPHRIFLGVRSSTDVNTSGTYTIAPLETDPLTISTPQVLKLLKPDTSDSYYLSYRQPVGFDSNLDPSFTSGLSIHHWDGRYFTHTYLLGNLTDGQTYSDANGYSFTQLSHDANGVRINIIAPACIGRPSPTVSILPSTQNVVAGTSVSWEVQITNNDAPGCGASTFSFTASSSGNQEGGGPANGKGSSTDILFSSIAPVSLGGGQTTNFAVMATTASGITGNYNVFMTASDSSNPTHTSGGSAVLSFGSSQQPTPMPTVTPSPTATPTPAPSATPTATPSPTPSATPTPSPTATPMPTATPTPSATPQLKILSVDSIKMNFGGQ